MSRNSFTTKKYWVLREAEVALTQAMKVRDVCRKLEASEQNLETIC